MKLQMECQVMIQTELNEIENGFKKQITLGTQNPKHKGETAPSSLKAHCLLMSIKWHHQPARP